MLAQGHDLLNLIPQRPPMVMIDKLISCDERSTSSSFNIDNKNIFIENGRFTASGLIENMAQTAAARTGWLALQAATGADFIAPTGVIGAIKNLEIYHLPLIGSELETRVDVIFEVGNATIISGRINVNDRLIAKCEMKIFLQNN